MKKYLSFLFSFLFISTFFMLEIAVSENKTNESHLNFSHSIGISPPLTSGFSTKEANSKEDNLKNDLKENQKQEEKINITSDKLVSYSNSKTVEFIGHVKAIQGTTEITSNVLKIFYKDKKKNAEDETIEKIIADGNVIIHFDDKTALTQQAEYVIETKVLTLLGKDSKVTSGKNSFTGAKITVYRIDGRVIVDNANVTIYSNDKGLK